MSSDYDALRARFDARIDELTHRSGKLSGHLRNKTRELPADWEERATVLENDEVLEGLEDGVLHEIEDLRRAVARIDDGSYGACASCGKKIGLRRLEARPAATLCIDCATEAEQNG